MLKIFFWILVLANGVLFGLNQGYWGAKAHESHEPERLKAQLHTEKLRLLSTSVDAGQAVQAEEIILPGKAPAAAAVAPVEKPVAVTPPAAPVAQAAALASAPASTSAPAPAPKVATAPVVAEPDLVCLEFADFNASDARKFDAALAGLALTTKPLQRSVEEIVSYMVHVPTSDGRTGADKKAAELRRQGVNDFYVMPGTYAIVALRWNISLGVFKTEKAAKAFVAELTGRGVKGLRITPRKSGSTRQIYQLREVDRATEAKLVRIMQKFSHQKMSRCQ